MEAISLRRIEPHLFRKSLYVFSLIFLSLKINSSQYSVSEHSFKEISSLFIKSALLCAYFASCGTSICCFATRYQYLRYVDMLLRNSICFRCTQTRYVLALRAIDMLPSATSAAMRLTRFSPISFCRKAKHIESPQGIYRAAAGGISNDASAAHIDVETIVCEDKQ